MEENNNIKSKKKIFIFIAILVAILLIAVVVAVIVNKNKSEDGTYRYEGEDKEVKTVGEDTDYPCTITETADGDLAITIEDSGESSFDFEFEDDIFSVENEIESEDKDNEMIAVNTYTVSFYDYLIAEMGAQEDYDMTTNFVDASKDLLDVELPYETSFTFECQEESIGYKFSVSISADCQITLDDVEETEVEDETEAVKEEVLDKYPDFTCSADASFSDFGTVSGEASDGSEVSYDYVHLNGDDLDVSVNIIPIEYKDELTESDDVELSETVTVNGTEVSIYSADDNDIILFEKGDYIYMIPGYEYTSDEDVESFVSPFLS